MARQHYLLIEQRWNFQSLFLANVLLVLQSAGITQAINKLCVKKNTRIFTGSSLTRNKKRILDGIGAFSPLRSARAVAPVADAMIVSSDFRLAFVTGSSSLQRERRIKKDFFLLFTFSLPLVRHTLGLFIRERNLAISSLRSWTVLSSSLLLEGKVRERTQ